MRETVCPSSGSAGQEGVRDRVRVRAVLSGAYLCLQIGKGVSVCVCACVWVGFGVSWLRLQQAAERRLRWVGGVGDSKDAKANEDR
jgi:hypothetical protein